MKKKSAGSICVMFILLSILYLTGCQNTNLESSSTSKQQTQNTTNSELEKDAVSETTAEQSAGQSEKGSEPSSVPSDTLDKNNVLTGELQEEVIDDDATQLTIKLINSTDREASYTSQIFLEQYKDEKWTFLYDNNIGETGVTLPSDGSSEEIFPLQGKLEEGQYRFVISYSLTEQDQAEAVSQKCYIEFTK